MNRNHQTLRMADLPDLFGCNQAFNALFHFHTDRIAYTIEGGRRRAGTVDRASFEQRRDLERTLASRAVKFSA